MCCRHRRASFWLLSGWHWYRDGFTAFALPIPEDKTDLSHIDIGAAVNVARQVLHAAKPNAPLITENASGFDEILIDRGPNQLRRGSPLFGRLAFWPPVRAVSFPIPRATTAQLLRAAARHFREPCQRSSRQP